jgi:hypothetical protein
MLTGRVLLLANSATVVHRSMALRGRRPVGMQGAMAGVALCRAGWGCCAWVEPRNQIWRLIAGQRPTLFACWSTRHTTRSWIIPSFDTNPLITYFLPAPSRERQRHLRAQFVQSETQLCRWIDKVVQRNDVISQAMLGEIGCSWPGLISLF